MLAWGKKVPEEFRNRVREVARTRVVDDVAQHFIECDVEDGAYLRGHSISSGEVVKAFDYARDFPHIVTDDQVQRRQGIRVRRVIIVSVCAAASWMSW